MVYKYIFSLVVILFISCSEIDRDNILDPKNPSSKRDRVLLLEAFVNTNNPFPYNDYALEAIENLATDDDIKDHLIILEYHRDTQQYTDPLEADSFNTENIYNSYINYGLGRLKGVPDLFINGAVSRVQGASTASNVANRIKDFAVDQLLEDGEYTIEVDFELNGSNIEGKYRIARLGKESSASTFLRMTVTYNSDITGKRTVSKVSNSFSIEAIGSGKYIEDNFIISSVPAGKAEKLVLILSDNLGINILHAIEREIL